MRRKCHNCLCHTCMNICCDRKKCPGKKQSCEKYSPFEQQHLFILTVKKEYHKAPRYSWDYYGIDKERRKELTTVIQSGDYSEMAHTAANTANKDIAEYILLSVMKNKSYEGVEYAEKLGRIPCGRTDFYGYRRLFYHLFNEQVKEMGR